jgi:hypothetical protein
MTFGKGHQPGEQREDHHGKQDRDQFSPGRNRYSRKHDSHYQTAAGPTALTGKGLRERKKLIVIPAKIGPPLSQWQQPAGRRGAGR